MSSIKDETNAKLDRIIHEFSAVFIPKSGMSAGDLREIARYFYWFGLENGFDLQKRQMSDTITSLPSLIDYIGKDTAIRKGILPK